MTDADRLFSCLRRIEQLKTDWDDKKYEELRKDCFVPLTQTSLRMQETEREIYAFIFGTERTLEEIENDM